MARSSVAVKHAKSARTLILLRTTTHLWSSGQGSGCAGEAYGWSGGGPGYKTDVWVDDTGSRVAVLLVNARHFDTAQPGADQAAHDAMARLYCNA